MAINTQVIGEAAVLLKADNTQFTKGLQQSKTAAKKWTDEVEGHFKRVNRAIDRMGKGLDKFGTGMSSAGKYLTAGVTAPILGAGAAMVKMAADAVESEDLFQRIFGSQASAVRQWSETFSKSVKMNSYETRRMAAEFMTMFTAMGLSMQDAITISTGLTERAHDLASAYNVDVATAFEKLKSGIIGQSEPMRSFGVVLLENQTQALAYGLGLAKVGEEVSQVAKVQARFVQIMSDTSAVAGNMAATIESPANKMRALRAQAELLAIRAGNTLLPFLEKAVAFGEKMLTAWEKLSPETRKWIMIAAVGAAAAGPFLMALGGITSVLGNLVSMTTNIAGFFMEIAMGISRVTVEGLVAVGVLASFLAGFYAIAKAYMAFKKTGNIGDALKAFLDSDNFGQSPKDWMGKAFDFSGKISETVDNLKAKMPELKAKLMGYLGQFRDMFGSENQPVETFADPSVPRLPFLGSGADLAQAAALEEERLKLLKKSVDEAIKEEERRYRATEKFLGQAERRIEDNREAEERLLDAKRRSVGFTSVEEMFRKSAVAGYAVAFSAPAENLGARRQETESLLTLVQQGRQALGVMERQLAQLEAMSMEVGKYL